MLRQDRQSAALLPCALALGVTALVYWPITQVYFHDDDFLHLYNAVNMPRGEFILQMFGGHLLLIPNAVFLLMHTFVGPRPEPFMWLMLATHLLNVCLLFAVARRVTQRPWLASGAAIAWGTLPLHVGALGWYSVYGQVICVSLFLTTLLCIERAAQGASSTRVVALAGGLVVAASASFGIALGFAVALPLVAFLIMPPAPARRRMVFGLVAALIASGALYHGIEWINSGNGALGLETAVRGNLRAPQILAQLVPHLFATGMVAVLSDGFFTPALNQSWIGWGALAPGALLLAGGMAVRGRAVAAFLLLSLAAYAPIAAGRGMFVQAMGAEWLTLQGRYHYGASIGLVLALALSLSAVIERVGPPPLARRALFGVWLAGMLAAHWLVTAPINRFDYQRRAVDSAVDSIHAAIAGAPSGAPVYIQNRRFAISMLPGIERNFPGLAAVFVIFVGDDALAGHRVYFVDPDIDMRVTCDGGLRSDGLLIAPEDVP